MSAEVLEHSLASLCLLVVDCPHATPEWTASGVVVLRNQNIKGGRLDLTTPSFTDEAHYLGRIRRAAPQEGDLVITREAPMGEVCQIPAGLKCCLGQRQVLLRPDPEKVDSRFLLYALQSPYLQHQIGWNEGTGSTVSNLRIPVLEALKVPTPSVAIQREVASVLGALDDRITLLRETNATLETIAQALFKSWFVDFDPVHAKAEGRQPEGMDAATASLFPGSFEESELGLVPKGWRVMPLGDICSVTIGGLWGNDDSGDSELVPAISLRGVDLEHLRANGFSKEAPVRWIKTTAMEKRRLSDREVLVAASGAGPCGRPLWAGAPFEVIYGRPVIFSNFVKRLDCGSPARAVYVDRLLAEMRESSEIWNFINGTSVPNLDDKLLLSTKRTVLPPDEVLSKFFDVAKTIYDSLYDQKAQTLTQLRDTLLPRLISGQMRLPEAETLLENAL